MSISCLLDRIVQCVILNRAQSSEIRHVTCLLELQCLCGANDALFARFRWVACQIDYLCDPTSDAARKKVLNKLPPTLKAMYKRMFKEVNQSNDDVKRLV